MGARGGPPFRASVLAEAPLARLLIPFDQEWWESACFELGWTRHGGSGLGRSYTELLGMPLPHIVRDFDRVRDRLKREGDAIAAAYKKKPT